MEYLVSVHLHDREGIDSVSRTTYINAGLRGTYRLQTADKNIELTDPDHADR